MSKHRRPSSVRPHVLSSGRARTSGAALVGTVLAVGLLPATAGAALAHPSTPKCQTERTAVTTAEGDLGAAKAALEAAGTDEVKIAAAEKLITEATSKLESAKTAKTACYDEEHHSGPEGGHGQHRSDRDHHGYGQHRDRDDEDADDEDDDDQDEAADDQDEAADDQADETDGTTDEKTGDAADSTGTATDDAQVAGVSADDSTASVVDVPSGAVSDVAGVSQIADVPVGSVDAGDGSTAGGGHIGEALVGLGALGLAGAGAGAVALQRRRRSA